MWIGVVSLFPEMFEAITRHGVTGRAVEKGRIALEFCQLLHEFGRDQILHQQILLTALRYFSHVTAFHRGIRVFS